MLPLNVVEGVWPIRDISPVIILLRIPCDKALIDISLSRRNITAGIGETKRVVMAKKAQLDMLQNNRGSFFALRKSLHHLWRVLPSFSCYTARNCPFTYQMFFLWGFGTFSR